MRRELFCSGHLLFLPSPFQPPQHTMVLADRYRPLKISLLEPLAQWRARALTKHNARSTLQNRVLENTSISKRRKQAEAAQCWKNNPFRGEGWRGVDNLHTWEMHEFHQQKKPNRLNTTSTSCSHRIPKALFRFDCSKWDHLSLLIKAHAELYICLAKNWGGLH